MMRDILLDTTVSPQILFRVFQELVSHMLQKDPEHRLSAEEYLVKQRGKAFPDVFYTSMKIYEQQYVDTIFPPDDKILLWAGCALVLFDEQVTYYLCCSHLPMKVSLSSNISEFSFQMITEGGTYLALGGMKDPPVKVLEPSAIMRLLKCLSMEISESSCEVWGRDGNFPGFGPKQASLRCEGR